MMKLFKRLFSRKPKPQLTRQEMVLRAIESGQIEVKVLADSISAAGKRLVTYQLKYWRGIHAEMMTHRLFSRNASSSRAIPVRLMLRQVWFNPAIPMHFGLNQSGMQAALEATGWRRALAVHLWKMAGRAACVFVWMLMNLGIHKQVANRILEPWQFIHVVLSATEYDNFFELRVHEDAQPEIYALAKTMKSVLLSSKPKLLKAGEWHLPYISDKERELHTTKILLQVSAARCCRVSYLRHDGKASSITKDLQLCDRLVGAEPLHASPFEHQATPDGFDARTEQWKAPAMHGNFVGWCQNRKYIESEIWLKKNSTETN